MKNTSKYLLNQNFFLQYLITALDWARLKDAQRILSPSMNDLCFTFHSQSSKALITTKE